MWAELVDQGEGEWGLEILAEGRSYFSDVLYLRPGEDPRSAAVDRLRRLYGFGEWRRTDTGWEADAEPV